MEHEHHYHQPQMTEQEIKAFSELYKEGEKDTKTLDKVMKEVNGSFDEIYEEEEKREKREEI